MKTVNFGVKHGVKLRKAHGFPHIWLMIDAAFDTAPLTIDGQIVITEAWRLPRHPDDAHTWCNAFDWRIHNLAGRTAAERIAMAWAWVERMRDKLDDPRYQFDVHGKTDDDKHVHMEFDPRQ